MITDEAMGNTTGDDKPGAERNAATPHGEIRWEDDWRLVQQCIQGDRDSWATLIVRHEPSLELAVRHTLRAHGVTPSAALVEDLIADVAISLVRRQCRKLQRYSGRCRLGAWLKVVASHHTIDALRRRRPELSLSDDSEASATLRATLPAPEPAPDEAIGQRQRLDALRALYELLPDEDRRFVRLFYEDGLNFEAVAEAMETTVGAVYARKNRVRKKLLKLASARGLR